MHMPDFLAEACRDAARRFGTPLYLYDIDQLLLDAGNLADAFGPGWCLLYSLKANSLTALTALLPPLGYGANAVSVGELRLAERAGFDPRRTTLEGIGKSAHEIREAVRRRDQGLPLLWVSLESADEARALADATGEAHVPRPSALDVLIRINPGVAPDTHPGLAVGRRDSKFGVLPDEIEGVITAGGGRDGPLRWRGIHVHAGSQMRTLDAWRDAFRAALEVQQDLSSQLPDFDTVDAGGGFPVLDPPDCLAPGAFAAAASGELAAAGRRPARLAIEPGRAVVARSGWLVSAVLHVRARRPRTVVLDAGMTELIRPALYGARHPIAAVTSEGRRAGGVTEPLVATEVHGPVCESTDYFGEYWLPPLARGDLVAIGDVGAYASTMASTYNGRSIPAAVLWQDGSLHRVRPRGNWTSVT